MLTDHDPITVPVREAAALFGSPEIWLRDLITRGEIAVYEVGRSRRRVVFITDISTYLRERCRVAREPVA